LATVFAETLSMAAVAYTSKMADRDHYFAERHREVEETKTVPKQERQEIADIYAAKGFSGQLLEDIVDHITANKDLWVDSMMRDELDLLPITKNDVYSYSLVVGISTLSGALLPLIPFFFIAVHSALVCSLILSVIILAAVGAYKATINLGKPLKSALQMVVIGMGAAIAGYLIGLIFKQ
jgi:predicted membrane protein (TIGR00267 family)